MVKNQIIVNFNHLSLTRYSCYAHISEKTKQPISKNVKSQNLGLPILYDWLHIEFVKHLQGNKKSFTSIVVTRLTS